MVISAIAPPSALGITESSNVSDIKNSCTESGSWMLVELSTPAAIAPTTVLATAPNTPSTSDSQRNRRALPRKRVLQWDRERCALVCRESAIFFEGGFDVMHGLVD